ncbi:uncharacterized protein BDR25DRAFT_213344 [Lindgomyces ingoldianus]|uniref:Uncharacterized protein n=1 Tax=Lindgomyces ingoldianus TaxID=673940 RepID=A0ACB6R9I7_9PLEO|nr:uncharacterized protein BDR25DRAFT_213344 [Lindgomyces ingoldianus]KAF2475182.1 hypothetical protein BDR25DRAFT_213344 [Lindgomyces ingoldianus]
MSHLQHLQIQRLRRASSEIIHYSQAVRIGDRIEIYGQGGWDRTTESIPSDIDKQIDLAFANVEHTSQNAG